MKSNLRMVREAIERCNWRKGYGDVQELKMFMDGRIEVTIRRPFMTDTVRRGRIREGRVFFAGTSAKIV